MAITSRIYTRRFTKYVYIEVNDLNELHGNLCLVIPTIIQYMKTYETTTPPINIGIRHRCGVSGNGLSTLQDLMKYATDEDKKQLNEVIYARIEQIKATLLE